MGATSVIAGRYRVEGRLGVGGMSTVLLAVDDRLQRHVAVKLLAEHLADDPSFVSRFRREALAAARLVHPNIVQVFDSGFDEVARQHFIVMEYVPGKSCAEMLRDRGPLDVGEVVDIVEQSCRGLEYAHRHGVVHRDVKPGNLLVSESGVVKLADFGIARATGQSSITQVGSVLGTAAYLAPEQARGEDASPATDLYSLGVVAYQLLSARLPYEANSLSELALKQQREAPIPLQRLNPAIPEALADAVALSISVVAEERPRTARRLAELIADGAEGISPYSDDAPTRSVGADQAATRVLGRQGRNAAPVMDGVALRSPARTPRVVPARRPPASEPVASRSRVDADGSRRRRGRRARVMWSLLVLVLIAVLAVVVVVALEQSSQTVVQEQKIVAHTVSSAISQFNHLIARYTKR
ncbi:MAG: protein kinase domain-containing protein [Solirubrobacteraceae bacterium]